MELLIGMERSTAGVTTNFSEFFYIIFLKQLYSFSFMPILLLLFQHFFKVSELGIEAMQLDFVILFYLMGYYDTVKDLEGLLLDMDNFIYIVERGSIFISTV